MKKTAYFSEQVILENFVFHICLGNLRLLIHIILYIVIKPKVLLNIIVHTAS